MVHKENGAQPESRRAGIGHARTQHTIAGTSVPDIVREVVVLLAIRTVYMDKGARNSKPARFMLDNVAAYTREIQACGYNGSQRF